VARWEPDARGRLQQAALELFAEHGYDRTTVEDIATRAGVTKRTFFRHFVDKREVLFGRGQEFRTLFLSGLDAAPADAAPLALIAAVLDPVAGFFAGGLEQSRRRAAVINASAELRERDLVKLAAVADALAAALRERGIPEPAASMSAETALAVFRTAFERWVTEGGDLGVLMREGLDALRAVASGSV
jgi:AcrR family transcriptional regulator